MDSVADFYLWDDFETLICGRMDNGIVCKSRKWSLTRSERPSTAEKTVIHPSFILKLSQRIYDILSSKQSYHLKRQKEKKKENNCKDKMEKKL